jgi:hypothetical protein
LAEGLLSFPDDELFLPIAFSSWGLAAIMDFLAERGGRLKCRRGRPPFPIRKIGRDLASRNSIWEKTRLFVEKEIQTPSFPDD